MEEDQINIEEIKKQTNTDFDLAIPHLQPGGVTAQVRRVDEAEAKDPDVATVERSDVTQSTVLQICYFNWLAC